MDENSQVVSKMKEIHEFIRYHGEYEVILNLFDVYGIYSIRVLRGTHQIGFDCGNTIEKRLDYALKLLKGV